MRRISLLLYFACLAPLAAQQPNAGGGLSVDLERGEIRIPCRFVNPSRVLEVFACHRQGPTHETVVEFDVTGAQLGAALLAIGCQGRTTWNISGPNDLEKTQGDRLLLLVRWEEDGKLRELPAEGLLADGGFGFPAFVRGFSYGARRLRRHSPGPAKDAELVDDRTGERESEARPEPEPRPAEIDQIVELTLGGTTRRSAVHSLLWHATTCAPLRRWMLPPVVHEGVIPDLPDLVRRSPAATLIIRRLKGEGELLEYVRSIAVERGLSERLELYRSIEPLTVLIDERKSELLQLARSLRDILANVENPEAGELGPGELRPGERSVERTVDLLARARVLVEQIEATYLKIYHAQEMHKLEWVARHPDIDDEQREEAIVLARSGFAFEPQIAARRVALARLDQLGVAADAPQRAALHKEVEVIEHLRSRQILEANLRYVDSRIASLQADDDYLKALFGGDRFRLRVRIRKEIAARVVAQSEVDELRARQTGRWEAERAEVLAARRAARELLEIAVLEEKLADAREEMRWAKNDLESQVPARRRKAAEDLAKFAGEAKRLESVIKKRRDALKQESSSPRS